MVAYCINAGFCGISAGEDGSLLQDDVQKAIDGAKEDGHDVLLAQTGNYFDRIGMIVIDAETDKITTDFIECVIINKG